MPSATQPWQSNSNSVFGQSHKRRGGGKMARDREKNAYFMVGLPLNSETYRVLKADSEETGVSIPQLLAVRIADWYKFSTSIGLASVQTVKLTGSTEQPEPPLTRTSDLQSRASAAAAAWGGNEDD